MTKVVLTRRSKKPLKYMDRSFQMKISFTCAAALITALYSTAFNVSAAIDASAPVIKLRTTCSDGFGSQLDNCFTSYPSAITWIKNTRNPPPSQSAPLLVEIGPGVFTGTADINCAAGGGYITFRGAGRNNTLISGAPSITSATFFANSCDSLAFESLTIESTTVGGYAVEWGSAGSSLWTNVELRARTLAWYDSESGGPCMAESGAKHEWFSSVIRTVRSTDKYPGSGNDLGVPTYYSLCGQSWFWGSEVENLNVNATDPDPRRAFLAISSGAQIHFYGGNIRVFSDTASTKSMVAVEAKDGASVHIHGSGIDVESAGDAPVTALLARTGSNIHANQSSYVLRTGSGSGAVVARLYKDSDPGSHIHAPYLWEHVPDAANFSSVNGMDQTTVTTGTNDGQPHSAIYSTTCPSNAQWYDQVDKVCRGL